MKRDEFDQYMCKTFPVIFKKRFDDMYTTCMCWGFDVGEGWHHLLIDLCTEIQAICNETGFEVYAEQVKEKFGGLRFYWNGNSDMLTSAYMDTAKEIYGKIEALVSDAELKSESVCESCGAPGKPNSKGWISTLCDACREKTRMPS